MCDPAEFVQTVKPVLARKDAPALVQLLHTRWTSEQMIGLLSCANCDARKVAALALALVGCKRCLPAVAELLRDQDPTVNQMAEHALWSIWFRMGCEQSNHHLCRGAKATDRGDYAHAIAHFDQAIELTPDFAEAYNQRALAEYLLERYDASLADCKRAIERMPSHFGAWAGMGHCHAHQGNLPEAISCYQRALDINPHMSQIRQALIELRGKLSR